MFPIALAELIIVRTDAGGGGHCGDVYVLYAVWNSKSLTENFGLKYIFIVIIVS
jgi:hypothetical protein